MQRADTHLPRLLPALVLAATVGCQGPIAPPGVSVLGAAAGLQPVLPESLSECPAGPMFEYPPNFALLPVERVSFRLSSIPLQAESCTLHVSTDPRFSSSEDESCPVACAVEETMTLAEACSGNVTLTAPAAYYYFVSATPPDGSADPVTCSEIRSFTTTDELLSRAWLQGTTAQFLAHEEGFERSRAAYNHVLLGFASTPCWQNTFDAGEYDMGDFFEVTGSTALCGEATPCTVSHATHGAEGTQGSLRLIDPSTTGAAEAVSSELVGECDFSASSRLSFYMRRDAVAAGTEGLSGVLLGHGTWIPDLLPEQLFSVGQVVPTSSCGGGDFCPPQFSYLDQSGGHHFSPPALYQSGMWHHVVLDRIAGASRIDMYIDGQLLVENAALMAQTPMNRLALSTAWMDDRAGLATFYVDQIRAYPAADVGFYASPRIDYFVGPTGKEGWGSAGWASTHGVVVRVAHLDGSSGTWALVPDELFSGQSNAAGFSTSPVNLAYVPEEIYPTLRLEATFTDSGGAVPYLDYWYVRWGGRCLDRIDGASCDGPEACREYRCHNFQCVDSGAVVCPELSDPCLSNVCNTETGTCENVPKTCVTDDPCKNSVGVCVEGACRFDENLDMQGEPCSSGHFCTVGETCQEGVCQGGTARNCTPDVDSVECDHEWLCDENINACVREDHFVEGTVCPDGNGDNLCATCTSDGMYQGEEVVCGDTVSFEISSVTEPTAGESATIIISALDEDGRITHGQSDTFCLSVEVATPQEGDALACGEDPGEEDPPVTSPDGMLCCKIDPVSGTATVTFDHTVAEEVLVAVGDGEGAIHDVDDVNVLPGMFVGLAISPASATVPACTRASLAVEAVDAFGNRVSAEELTAPISMDVKLVDGETTVEAELRWSDSEEPLTALSGELEGSSWRPFTVDAADAGTATVVTKNTTPGSDAGGSRATVTFESGHVDPMRSTLDVGVTSVVVGAEQGATRAEFTVTARDYCGEIVAVGADKIELTASRGTLSPLRGTEGVFEATWTFDPGDCPAVAELRATIDGVVMPEPLRIDLSCDELEKAAFPACAGTLPPSLAGLLLAVMAMLGARRRRPEGLEARL